MTFSKPTPSGTALRFTFDGQPLEARRGDSVAAALLAAGVGMIRSTPKTGKPRLPYCLMGVCFDCLVEVDGEPNCQACMVEVKEGMHVRRQDFSLELLS